MDYEKMWTELKWRLICNQGGIMLNKTEGNKKLYDFTMKIIARVLNIMEDLERGGN